MISVLQRKIGRANDYHAIELGRMHEGRNECPPPHIPDELGATSDLGESDGEDGHSDRGV